ARHLYPARDRSSERYALCRSPERPEAQHDPQEAGQATEVRPAARLCGRILTIGAFPGGRPVYNRCALAGAEVRGASASGAQIPCASNEATHSAPLYFET